MFRGRKVEAKLRAFLDGKAANALSPSPRLERYAPDHEKYGGWRVFDRRSGRFLTDRETLSIPLDDLLKEPLAPS